MYSFWEGQKEQDQMTKRVTDNQTSMIEEIRKLTLYGRHACMADDPDWFGRVVAEIERIVVGAKERSP
jgi:hypothetical protein